MNHYQIEDRPTVSEEREELDRALARHQQTLQHYDPKQALQLVRRELNQLHKEAAARKDLDEMHRLKTIWQLTESHMRLFLEAANSIVAIARQLRTQRDAALEEINAITDAAAEDVSAHPVTLSVDRNARREAAAHSWETFTREMAEGIVRASGVDEQTALGVIEFLASKSLDSSGLAQTIAALQSAAEMWEVEG